MCRLVQGSTTAGTVSFCSSRSRRPLPTAWECPGQGGDAGGQAQLSRSCWAPSRQWVAVSPAPLSPSALQEGQAEEPASVLRPPAGGGWRGCSSCAVPKCQTQGRMELAVPRGPRCGSSQPPPQPRPAPSEHCAVSHLRPHSPRSASRPKAKSGLSRTQSECPWQSFPSPQGPWWKGGSCPALGRGGTGAPES